MIILEDVFCGAVTATIQHKSTTKASKIKTQSNQQLSQLSETHTEYHYLHKAKT